VSDPAGRSPERAGPDLGSPPPETVASDRAGQPPETVGPDPAAVRIGTSGWSYDHWRDVLYPPGTRDRLSRYAELFDTVELNGSFYRWPSDASFAAWRSRVPPTFRMSVKAPRGLTHARRLGEPHEWIARIRRGLSGLGAQRGVLLVQLPPDMERDDDRLDAFLAQVPDLPVAVELRHPSWACEEVFALLGRRRAAYVVTSGAGLACVPRATTDFVYVRLHGPDPDHLYAGSYSDEELARWAARIARWRAQGRAVWCYFNNDGHGHAVRNARTLATLLRG